MTDDEIWREQMRAVECFFAELTVPQLMEVKALATTFLMEHARDMMDKHMPDKKDPEKEIAELERMWGAK